MSLFKNPWFWIVVGIVAAVSAYMLRSISAVGFMICYILAPIAFGSAVRTYLDKCDFVDELMDAAWRSDAESRFERRAPIVLWN